MSSVTTCPPRVRRRPLLLAAAVAAALSACTDRVPPTATPSEKPPREITLQPDGRLAQKSLKDYAQYAVNGDWTPALQRAVNEAQTVFVPAGTYPLKTYSTEVDFACPRPGETGFSCSHIWGTVKLPSNTRVYGEGAASLLQVVDGNCALPGPMSHASVFMAGNTFGGSATHLIVENLGFAHSCENTPADNFFRFALWVRRGSNVAVRNNTVRDLGLVQFDQYLEYWNSSLDVPTGGYPGNLEVIGNDARGRRSGNGTAGHGIVIGFANGATVRDNQVSNYFSGIQWWGGNGYNFSGQDRKVSNLTIRANLVLNVNTGIWGAMGKTITVASNEVQECWDLCLDAEDSDDVVFEHNIARYGVNGGLGVLFLSRNVVFRFNRVYQNDQPRLDAFGDPTVPSQYLLNINSNKWGVTVTAHDNEFVYTGAGYGVVTKNNTERFVFDNNRLTGTVIRLGHPPALSSGGNQGAVQITNNTLHFPNRVTEAAILVTNNHGPSGAAAQTVNGGYEVYIGWNRISSAIPQYVPGIDVYEETEPSTPVDTWIYYNSVRDFHYASPSSFSPSGLSIRVRPTNSPAKRFRIEENGISASVPAATSSVTVLGNYRIDLSPPRIAYQVRGPSYADWQGERWGNENAGTTGQGRNLEAMKVRIAGPLADGVCYEAYVDGLGWRPEVCNGASAGTVGQNRRLRAFRVRLVNPYWQTTDYKWTLCYQAYMGNTGWGPEVCEGEVAGSATAGTTAIQAIRVRALAVYTPPGCSPTEPLCENALLSRGSAAR